MMTSWWVWLAAAALLGLLEILAPAQVFLGFAIGAALVGLGLWMGLSLGWPWLVLVCAIIALIVWIVLRQVLGIRRGQVKVWDRDINED